jgi:hypothetical protein
MDDVISRTAAIDYFVTNVGFHDEDGYPIEDECELREIWTGYFDGIPTAQPERIKARWVLAENQRPEDMENDNYLFVCSNCGSTDLHSKRVPVSYCWDCGAYMIG